MEPERIGKTPKERLAWIVQEAYRKGRTEGDLLNLLEKLRLFIESPVPVVPGRIRYLTSEQYFDELLESCQDMIEQAIKRLPLDRPATQVPPSFIEWDENKDGYIEKVKQSQKTAFQTLVQIKLFDLIKAHGHLIKRCDAPAKMKPGRKAKGAPVEKKAKCGNPFVAVKRDQHCCSTTCTNRDVTRRKRSK